MVNIFIELTHVTQNLIVFPPENILPIRRQNFLPINLLPRSKNTVLLVEIKKKRNNIIKCCNGKRSCINVPNRTENGTSPRVKYPYFDKNCVVVYLIFRGPTVKQRSQTFRTVILIAIMLNVIDINIFRCLWE